MEKSLSVMIKIIAFWEKVWHKQIFSAFKKGAFLSLFKFFRKLPTWPTHGTSMGRYVIIFHLASIFWNCATVTSWKSGLNLPTLKIFISVLSDKAVLGQGLQNNKYRNFKNMKGHCVYWENMCCEDTCCPLDNVLFTSLTYIGIVLCARHRHSFKKVNTNYTVIGSQKAWWNTASPISLCMWVKK